MSIKSRMSLDVRRLVYIAVLTALIFVVQLIPIRPGGMSLAVFTLAIIVIGAALCGVGASAWLGLVFGIAVMVLPETALFWSYSWAGTLITVLLKGLLAGIASGAIYKLLERINRYIAVIAAAVIAPVVNSGIFFIGCMIFFQGYFATFAAEASVNVATFVIVFVIGINFLIELAVSAVFAPVVYRIINIKKKA